MQDDKDRVARSRGFPPVVGPDPRVLVLGTLPGRASLDAGEYYAQSRNAFWTVMGALSGALPELDYKARLDALKLSGVSLWDVLHEATRPGSLDSSIVAATQRINDVAGLVDRHRSISLVAFNGQKAAHIFRRHIVSALTRSDFSTVTLPSTSPAYASLRPAEKLDRWRRAVAPHLRTAST